MKYLIETNHDSGLPIIWSLRRTLVKENAKILSKYADKQRRVMRNNTQIGHFCGESLWAYCPQQCY